MSPSRILAIIAIALPVLVLSFPAGSYEIYQWVDDEGVIHFSDTKPQQGADVEILRVSATNPPGYDPSEDPYSIRNQAARTSELWTELSKRRQEREAKRPEQMERAPAPEPPRYDDYRYAAAPFYYRQNYPGRIPRQTHRLRQRQISTLEEFGLTGPPAYSINSGGHRARIVEGRKALRGGLPRKPATDGARR